jgi:Derlin-2/3
MNQLEEWFFDIPPITRAYLCGIALVTAGVVMSEMNFRERNMYSQSNYQQLQWLAPLHLFFSWKLIYHGQYWRLLSSFFYFGSLSFDLLFHLYFL